MTNIWIDADSCPTLVRHHAQKIAAKQSLKIFFVANKQIPGNTNFPYEMIICSQEKDAADNYILENATPNDLVITRDILFAGRLVEKNIPAINDRGTEFTKNNITDLIADRNFDFALAQAGVVKHFKSEYSKKELTKFANCLDKVLNRLLNN